MRKVIYIIPGFMHKCTDKGYQRIIQLFKAKNFKVIPVHITWKYRVMSDYVDEFLSSLSHRKTDEVSVLGFSYGAMIAYISAPKLQPKTLLLCSLSPYFKEDLQQLKKSWINIVGKKRMQDFEKFSFTNIAGSINAHSVLFAGEKEAPELHRRVSDAHRKIKHSKRVTVRNTGHDISKKEYLASLTRIV